MLKSTYVITNSFGGRQVWGGSNFDLFRVRLSNEKFRQRAPPLNL
jgi:hypothetical protein